MKVKIKNYQAIKDAELQFEPGITVIVGNSNNGKSSIIRAIEAAINNKGGNSFINYDATECSVEIEDLNNKVIWVKSKRAGKSSYELNGTELNKIGQKQLDEVGELLNMPEIIINNDKIRLNFWKQMDFPFLVGKTPYQLFDFISRSKEQELMSSFQTIKEDQLKINNKEINTLHSNIDLRTNDIEETEEELRNLEKFNSIDVAKFEALINMHNKLDTDISRYYTLNNNIDESMKVLKASKELEHNLSEQLSKAETIIGVYTDLADKFAKLNILNNYITSGKKQLAETKIDKIETKINELEPLVRDYTKINVVIDKYTNAYTNLTLTTNNIIKSNKEKETNLKLIEDIEKELSEFKVCPMCNQSLDNHKENHT